MTIALLGVPTTFRTPLANFGHPSGAGNATIFHQHLKSGAMAGTNSLYSRKQKRQARKSPNQMDPNGGLNETSSIRGGFLSIAIFD